MVKYAVFVHWTFFFFFFLEVLDFLYLTEKQWQCVMQMEKGDPVASGSSDHTGAREVPYHRASGQSLLMGFGLGLLLVGITHFLEQYMR